jgi:hypothetical protein
MAELTLGQKRVGVNFNPSENKTVNEIKNKAADLIDLIETLREGGLASEEKHRLISIAQTEIETGCMYGVKSVFTDQC